MKPETERLLKSLNLAASNGRRIGQTIVNAIRIKHHSEIGEDATDEDVAQNTFYISDDRLADLVEEYAESL